MARFALLTFAAVTLLLLVQLAGGPPALAQEWASANLGAAGLPSPNVPPQAGDGFAVALISEASQGHSDLNGDGDATDAVPFVVDDSGALANLRLAIDPHSWYRGVAGDSFLFVADEAFSGGQDLNGDGDAGDEVLHFYSRRNRRAVNLHLAVDGFLAGDPLSVLLVPESSGVDLNDDGDSGDRVAHLFDDRTGAVTNLHLAVASMWSVWLAGGTVAFGVSEVGQGMRDFNGDGDVMDNVLIAGAGKRLWSTRLAARAAWTNGEWLACPVYEASHGWSDLNGDGDMYDEVLHLVDLRSGEILNERLALGYRGSSQDLYTPVFSAERLVFAVGEARQGGTDLDGDGDASDAVAHVIELDEGGVHDTRLALSESSYYPMAVAERQTALLVSEAANGGRDLNGDGDLDDDVLHVVGANLRLRPWNIGLAGGSYYAGRMQWAGDELLFVVPERNQRQDRNGDGDTEDVVLHRLDSTGTATSVELASGTFAVRKQVVVLAVAEAAQGFDDLDGDGLVHGDVPFSLDLETSQVENLGYSIETHSGELALGDGFLLAPSREPWQVDRNGDGDWLDEVLVFARRSPASKVVLPQ